MALEKEEKKFVDKYKNKYSGQELADKIDSSRQEVYNYINYKRQKELRSDELSNKEKYIIENYGKIELKDMSKKLNCSYNHILNLKNKLVEKNIIKRDPNELTDKEKSYIERNYQKIKKAEIVEMLNKPRDRVFEYMKCLGEYKKSELNIIKEFDRFVLVDRGHYKECILNCDLR